MTGRGRFRAWGLCEPIRICFPSDKESCRVGATAGPRESPGCQWGRSTS
ncbi:hypothetical protein [Mesorhizobium neociceri]